MPEGEDADASDRLLQSQVYAERAHQALAEAEASPLPNVRHRFLTAAKRWLALARQSRRMEERKEGQTGSHPKGLS